MKRIMAICAVAAVIVASGPVRASVTWTKVDFDSLIADFVVSGNDYAGAISYDASGDNVVVSGSAFHTAVSAGNYVSLQKIGGDGLNNPIEGNFALYGLFEYTDTYDVFDWARSQPDTLFALEVRAWGVEFDVDEDGVSDGSDNFTLDAKDMPGVPFLQATFNELAGWGNTEVAPGVWMDIAMDENKPGFLALSVVIDGYVYGDTDLEAFLLPGALQGPIPGTTPGSGFHVAPVPEPATAIIWSVLGLLGIVVGGLRRRKK